MTVRINCFIKNCIYKTLERVMILNCFRINCIIKKIALSCCWSSNIFSLYDLFEIRSFIRDYVMTSWYWHNYFRINCFIKWIAFTEFLNASRYRRLFESIVSSENLHLFVVDFDTFLLYDLIMTCCQCRCVLTDIWILNCRVNCIVRKFASVCRRFRYVFAVWFDHDLLSISMCSDWYMNSRFLFLTKIFFFF